MKIKLLICSIIIAFPVMSQDTPSDTSSVNKSTKFMQQIKSVFMKISPEQKGDKMYDYYNYLKASYYYEREDSLSTSALRKLSDCYVKLASFDKAALAFQKLTDRSDCVPSDFYNCANLLKMNGLYEDADVWMKRYVEKAPNEKRAILNSDVYEKSSSLMKDQGVFQLTNCGMNTPLQEFASGLYYDQLIYSASAPRKGLVIKEYLGSGQTFLDLYIADIDGDTVQTFNPFVPSFNRKYHEGAATFSGDFNKIFFTANNYSSGRKKESGNNIQLYYAEKNIDGEWSDPLPFQLNKPEFSIGHPSLSADGKTLFFASNMPGGYGGSDIYKVSLLDTGWSTPVNLGPEINTEGDELFPNYIDKTQLLLFSSNGRYGLGGLDMYLASLKFDKYIRPMNLGAPLNSSADDFGFFLASNQKSGYLSSNRKSDGKGNDDIYYVKLLKELPNPWKEINGVASNNFGRSLANTKIHFKNETGDYVDSVVTDANGKYAINLPIGMKFTMDVTKPSYRSVTNILSTNTTENILSLNPVLDHRVVIKGHVTNTTKNEPLTDATVVLYTKNFTVVDSVKTDKDGNYRFDVFDKKEFVVVTNKFNFFSDTVLVNSEEINDVIEGDLAMAQILPESTYSVEDEMFLRVRTIYFDWNSSNLRADKSVLDEVVKILNDFPNLEIELGSHTDCRGSMAYNQNLSEARANTSAGYIKSRISNSRRIKARGYGEKKLVNDCECEGTRIVPCSEEDHQMNRRTEFKIVKK
jgi:outer membrane protein OmpA-like peptidoglycan-associated protein